MDFLGAIIGLAKLAESFYSLWAKTQGQDRQSLCLWLGACGRVMEEISQQLHAGIYPHAKCAYLQYLLENSLECAEKYLTAFERQQFLQMIDNACRVEGLFGQLQELSDADRKRNLAEFDRICGTFQGFLTTALALRSTD